ncbi:MAG: hypothetical protein U0804_03290 [Gemmataceae bacterium]
MRLLFCVPHYFAPKPGGRYGSTRPDAAARARALADLLAGVRTFARPQCVLDIARRTTTPANHLTAGTAHVLVCTTGGRHVLDRLPAGLGFAHLPTAAEPRLLGYECHAALRDRLAAGYDYYCYLEDDLVLRDPLFFVKLRWFAAAFGEGALLQPNRFEAAAGRAAHKAYLDGPLRPDVTARFQDVADAPELRAEALGLPLVFRRPLNPHAGCFFLTAGQMAAWAARPDFLDRSAAFIGPLESAATLGVMRAFKVYKPADGCAAFLEVEHAGDAFLSLIRPAPAART